MNKTSLAVLALIAGLAQTVAAHATICSPGTLCRADTITNIGSIGTPTVNLATTSTPTNGPFSGAVADTLAGNSFGIGGVSTVVSDFSTSETVQQAPTGTTGPTDSGWNFYDDYFFSTTASTSNNATVISNFSENSISSLQVRLFSTGPSNTQNLAPTLGIPTGGAVDGWTGNLVGSNGSFSILLPTGFPPGSYDLQVRGEAIGNNASYGGTLQIAPVPLPAGLPLLLSGLGLMGGMIRRRRLP